MKIAIAGMGYVGLSNAILLSQHHEVVVLDISESKVIQLNQKISPIKDDGIENFLNTKKLNLRATLEKRDAFSSADYIIIATPTDYNPEINYFETGSIESVIQDAISINPNATLVIKSTIPLGYTIRTRQIFGIENLIFSPEFLREGSALADNLFPSRIVVGEKSTRAKVFSDLLLQGATKKDVPVLFTGPTEAEAIKLFANSYLAMRVAFFNELDTYAATNKLVSKEVIDGIGLDPRIGLHYNNPSFGYGGYCLPKDTKQLLANYKGIPQKLIQAIVESNNTRMEFIAHDIARRKPNVVGVYRLIMKAGSDNFRTSAVLEITQRLMARGITVVIFEPTLKESIFYGAKVIQDIEEFKNVSDLIISNRMDFNLTDITSKIYSRDISGNDL